MSLEAARATARAAAIAAALTVTAATPAVAGPVSASVTVTVEIASSSGVCGVRTGTVAAGVTCGPLGQTVIGAPGASPLQRIGTIPAAGVVTQPLPLYGDATKFTSWRIVQLNNADYVELTIVW